MLALPERGINRSVNSHNCDLNILCDWLEASIAFDDDELSQADVIDVLTENGVYSDSDFAEQCVSSIWSEMRRRIVSIHHPLGITFTGGRVTRGSDWDQFSPYSFCLTLACTALYPTWARDGNINDAGYGDQGALFEEVTQESLSHQFAGWTIRRTGWSPDNPIRLREAVGPIIAELKEVAGSEWETHVDNHANELGLDLLAYRPYGDSHASFPVFLIQCASGKNWKTKRHTPDLKTWQKIVSFNSHPIKAFAMPFAYCDAKDFRRDTASVDGLFLDRNRLVGAFQGGVLPISAGLNQSLIDWIRPRVDTLPRDE